MTRIEGFWIYWGGERYVWAEREAAPKHKYRFEVSADWKPIGKLWISPVDVADGYSVKDAERLATGAADWTTSHRSRTPYQGTDWADTIRAPMRGRESVKFKNYFNDSRQ
jgi:hypothetical protein